MNMLRLRFFEAAWQHFVRLSLTLALPLTVMAQIGSGARSIILATEGEEPIPLVGINFSPYVDGQNPTNNVFIANNQIVDRLRIIAPYVRSVRTFSATNGLENIPRLAASMGLKVAAGAWISADLAANEREINGLISIGQSGKASVLIVGSEVLLRGDLSETVLLAYMARVKAAVPGVPVTYADTYGMLLAHPAVMAASDQIFANYYPYWEGISVSGAMASVHGWHLRMKASAGNKLVVVSEAGWPSAGNTIGAAVASTENSKIFLRSFVTWARQQGIYYYYFEAFDENWKATPQNPQEAHWGIWTTSGTLKPGLGSALYGATSADTWSPTIPGGAGAPSLEFTSVPALSSTAALLGRVEHILPSQYRVVVYIKVQNTWWIKPYEAAPLTAISSDGTWSCAIVTGGNDALASTISAFLVPANFSPPIVLGGAVIPSIVTSTAVAAASVNRP